MDLSADGIAANDADATESVAVTQQAAAARALCSHCRRPTVVCYCSDLTLLPTATNILILQHPRESNVAINTARIAHLCLPNSTLRVGIKFTNDHVVQAMLTDPRRPAVVLYPSDSAHDLATDPPVGPVTLIVLDGTWWQASKLWKLNPTLWDLPKYQVNPKHGSTYRIRAEPAEHCLSTLEGTPTTFTSPNNYRTRVQPLP